MERWLSTSKALIVSISSPQNSSLKGVSSVKGKISNISPLTANCPFPETCEVFSKPSSASLLDNLAISKLSPVETLTIFSFTYESGSTLSSPASRLNTTVDGSFSTSLLSTSSLPLTIALPCTSAEKNIISFAG